MSMNRIPVWAAVLMLSSATLAYGQAVQVPTPGGTVPPVATNPPQILQPPGPSPQAASGQNAVVPAPGGTVPPTAPTPPAETRPPGPSPQGGTTGH